MIVNSIKNFILPFAVCVCIALAMYPNYQFNPEDYSTEGLNLDSNISQKDLAIVVDKKTPNFTPELGKSFQGFKEALAFKESQGNYFTVNTLGYLGRYQFGSGTLALLGIYNTKLFLKDPKLQEKAFIANLERNKWVLRREIKRFVGKTVSGVKITESGILASAHLAGPGNVKKFLRSGGGIIFFDAYGTSVHFYMKKFQGYDMSTIEADKKAKAI